MSREYRNDLHDFRPGTHTVVRHRATAGVESGALMAQRIRWTATGPVWEAWEGPGHPEVPQWNSLEYHVHPRMDEDLWQYAQRVGETVAAYVTYKAESMLEHERAEPIQILPPTIIEEGQREGRP